MPFLESRFYFFKIAMVGIFLLSLTHTAFAQNVPNWASNLSLTPSTNSPAPGGSLDIKVESYVTDLNSANIIWSIDGKEFGRGVGKTQITITAPALGKSMRVTATAVAPDGQRLNNSLVVGSGDIDLVIETSGYVPPFFRGKVPMVYQNTFKVVAIPHLADSAGKEYSPSNLVYQWKKDWKALPEDSGYGKQALILTGDIIPRPYVLSVTVSTRDGRISTEKYISVEPGLPSINFYQDDSLYGPLFNKALKNQFNLGSTREVGVLAVPFGFNKPLESLGSLSFSWLVNGFSRPELSNNQSVTLRAPEEQSGGAVVKLQIRNQQEILQGGEASFTAVFSRSPESAFGGITNSGGNSAGSETF